MSRKSRCRERCNALPAFSVLGNAKRQRREGLRDLTFDVRRVALSPECGALLLFGVLKGNAKPEGKEVFCRLTRVVEKVAL